MKIIFLGTNGWYTSPIGNTTCILIDSESHYIVFDAGNGLYKLDGYITEDKPITLFVSHFHLDHVSGFHTLAKFKFPQGIDIYVTQSRKKDFETLVNAPYTVGIDSNSGVQLNTRLRLHELSEGKHDVGFPVEVIRLQHAFEDHGYRVALEGKTIAYSGDTGICPNSKVLAQDADLLIHECSFTKIPDGYTWGHTDPELTATLAKDSNVKRLILTHFDPTQYPTLDKRKEAEKEAQKIFPSTQAATDDMIVEL